MSTANVAATNAIVREVLASMKSGALLDGTVHSHPADGSTKLAWIAIEIPAVGERRVLVETERQLPLGQEVVIECVPSPSKPGRYKFQIADDPASPAVG